MPQTLFDLHQADTTTTDDVFVLPVYISALLRSSTYFLRARTTTRLHWISNERTYVRTTE